MGVFEHKLPTKGEDHVSLEQMGTSLMISFSKKKSSFPTLMLLSASKEKKNREILYLSTGFDKILKNSLVSKKILNSLRLGH